MQKTCKKCGAQIYDPFIGQTKVHFEKYCNGMIKPKTVDVNIIKLPKMKNKMKQILKEIEQERKNQDNKWGEQNHKPIEWVAILMEEVGEASKEALNHHFENGLQKLKKEGGREIIIASIQEDRLKRYREEMIQVAAVAVAMVESLDRNELNIKQNE